VERPQANPKGTGSHHLRMMKGPGLLQRLHSSLLKQWHSRHLYPILSLESPFGSWAANGNEIEFFHYANELFSFVDHFHWVGRTHREKAPKNGGTPFHGRIFYEDRSDHPECPERNRRFQPIPLAPTGGPNAAGPAISGVHGEAANP